MAPVLSFSIFQKTSIYLTKNIYFNNVVYDPITHVAAGSVVKAVMGGPNLGLFFSEYNKYIGNFAESKGVVIAFSAYFVEKNSLFFGYSILFYN